MRVRIALLVFGAGLLGVGAFYATVASGGARIAPCSAVHVSRANFNGLSGGLFVASVKVKNLSSRACTISGRPWIRLGPLRHGITVEDATRTPLGSYAGVPGQVVTLQPGQRAYGAILLGHGNCDYGQMFGSWIRGGWANRSVKFRVSFCMEAPRFRGHVAVR